ncbi:MAG: hypothetical protein RLZ11_1117 [Bacteroidota bacterium]|jgi:hypothetical protein
MARQKHLRLFIDLIGPSKDWPTQIRMLLFGAKHLTNQQRFSCTVFLLANGISPRQIREFYAQTFNFDQSAWRQIDWIITKYPTSNWKQWNVMMQRSI